MVVLRCRLGGSVPWPGGPLPSGPFAETGPCPGLVGVVVAGVEGAVVTVVVVDDVGLFPRVPVVVGVGVDVVVVPDSAGPPVGAEPGAGPTPEGEVECPGVPVSLPLLGPGRPPEDGADWTCPSGGPAVETSI